MQIEYVLGPNERDAIHLHSSILLTTTRVTNFQIRLKRLAKLQAQQSASPSSSGTSTPAAAAAPAPKPKPIPPPSRPQDRQQPIFQEARPTVVKPTAPPKFDLATWEPEIVAKTLRVTLKVSVLTYSC